MGSGSKKKGGIDMGSYTVSIKEREAYIWCVHNGIYISPQAKSPTEWHLCIVINKKTSVSPETYQKDVIWKQLYKFYVYYYDKYANNITVSTVESPKEKLTKQKQLDNKDNNLILF